MKNYRKYSTDEISLFITINKKIHAKEIFNIIKNIYNIINEECIFCITTSINRYEILNAFVNGCLLLINNDMSVDDIMNKFNQNLNFTNISIYEFMRNNMISNIININIVNMLEDTTINMLNTNTNINYDIIKLDDEYKRYENIETDIKLKNWDISNDKIEKIMNLISNNSKN